MRYTRLRRQIESGTLIGTHGAPFTSATTVEKIAEAGKKRKRTSSPSSVAKKYVVDKEKIDKKEIPTEQGKKVVVDTNFPMVKKEQREGSTFDSSESDDSEDEIPLAKLRKAKVGSTSVGGNGIPKSMGANPGQTTVTLAPVEGSAISRPVIRSPAQVMAFPRPIGAGQGVVSPRSIGAQGMVPLHFLPSQPARKSHISNPDSTGREMASEACLPRVGFNPAYLGNGGSLAWRYPTRPWMGDSDYLVIPENNG
jgi:hypothetical protein